jgi:CubicO group peptidase (beta-lactamase class C family)
MTNLKLSFLLFLLLNLFAVKSQSQVHNDRSLKNISIDYGCNTSADKGGEEEDLYSPAARLAQQQAVESALTLLENKNQLIPFLRLDTLRIAAISLGSMEVTPFQKMLGNYANVEYFNLSDGSSDVEINALIKNLGHFNLIIFGVHSSAGKKHLNRLPTVKNKVIVFFSSPENVSEMDDYGYPDGLLLAYENTVIAQQLAAQLLFGGICAKGKLPVSIGHRYHSGNGLTVSQPIRLKYTLPEEVGLNSSRVNGRIDSIVNNALLKQAFPGCNVLVAKDGKVIFQKAYGFHTYEKRVPSALDDIYDLASVTKVSGALPAIMKLNEEGKYLLDLPFSTYWTDWKKGLFHPSNKSDVTVRELLSHQAGLVPYIPFWKQSMRDKALSHCWYSVDQNEKFGLEVTPGLYLDSRFKKRVYKAIRKSPLETRGKYVYSCLSFIIAPEVISKLAGMKYTDYLDQNFYRPLGATTVTYNPFRKFSEDQIVPTEYDALFRKRLVHGSVHDEASAVLGGISGNAGLFASANDLAKLVQMYVQYGTYGGKQYLKRSTLETFNTVQFPQNHNRRALGFDKPLIDNQKYDRNNAYPCPAATPQSFGHSGFTGTFFWADPSNGLIYIFLSNRVNPTRENNKISDLNVRTEILQVMYEELGRATLIK